MRRITGWILTSVFIVAPFVQAETTRVVILPFDVHARERLSYLREEIPSLLQRLLEAEGAEVIRPDFPEGSLGAVRFEHIRRIGAEHNAEYAIWGSFTRIGKRFSLDAKMIESYGIRPPVGFYEEGANIAELPGAVTQMSKQFGMRLFAREPVLQVLIRGNRRIEADAVLRRIQTRSGDIYSAKTLSEDLRSVYAMGFFDDIRIEAEDTPKGKVILFHVREKPTVRLVRISGNRVFKNDKIQEDALTIETGSILNVFEVKRNIRRIESMYQDKNYHSISINYKIHPLDNNQADLEFIIDEGKRLRIREINIIGNTAFSDKKLKGIMKTSEKGFWSWLTDSGNLNPEDLNQDLETLSAFYRNHGYIHAKIGDADIDFEENGIRITLKIEEGDRYKVGEVDVTGDLVAPKKELLSRLKITGEPYYNHKVALNDKLVLTDIYSDEGYAYADIIPDVQEEPDTNIVDVIYRIRKGKQVFFEKIIITGNTKTRDKVIRRELKVVERERFSGRKLKRGIRNLHRLEFFEDIQVDTLKGTADDQMILKIHVNEKPTGTLSFGGGYSSIENFFVMAAIQQRNLFGRGQILQLRGEVGGTTTRYTLSFTEPWLFDIPLSAGFDVFNWKRDYDTYDKDTKGGGVRFGYPVWDFTRLYLSYSYELADISDITEDASESVWELEGSNVTSSVSSTLRYDSRDKIFNPTKGSDHSFTVQYAGLGGDIGFTKYLADTGWYIPLFRGTVGFLHGRGGYVTENSGGKLPDYEKFYLGGINSLRGFDWRDIHLTDEDGAKIGGEKFIQFNVEYLIPLIREAGIMGVLFFDTGNVYDETDDIDFGELRESAGFGIRWYSPMGPIRIEYGHILDPEEGEGDGRWEFTMGSAF